MLNKLFLCFYGCYMLYVPQKGLFCEAISKQISKLQLLTIINSINKNIVLMSDDEIFFFAEKVQL